MAKSGRGRPKKVHLVLSKKYKLEEVNVKNTTTWTACNNDSKHRKYRAEFLALFGGEFIPDTKKNVKWQPIPEPIYVPLRLLRFLDINKKIVEIDNLTSYCRDNNLSRIAMYEVLTGVRLSHKGFTAPGGRQPKSKHPIKTQATDDLPPLLEPIDLHLEVD